MYHFPVDSACAQLRMDIETDSTSTVSEEHIEAAIKFGVKTADVTDTKKYIIAFLKRLLLHREKLEKNLLDAHLNSMILKLWQEVRSSLEETNRKVVNVQSGSLIFTLFCPTGQSLLQLQDERWRIGLQGKVDKLLNALGMYSILQYFTFCFTKDHY